MTEEDGEAPESTEPEGADPEDAADEQVPPGQSFLIGCGIGLALLIIAAPCILIWSFRRAAIQDRASREALDSLKLRLEAHREERGSLPVSLGLGDDFSGQKALFTAGFNVEAKALHDGLLVDGWGRPWIYRCTEQGPARFYSCGPNGRDEDGQFDDRLLILERQR
jgi:hypothetical protein